MKCESCKFYLPIDGHEWKGTCGIELPPHLQEAANNYSWLTRADSGCDLGKPKDKESKE